MRFKVFFVEQRDVACPADLNPESLRADRLGTSAGLFKDEELREIATLCELVGVETGKALALVQVLAFAALKVGSTANIIELAGCRVDNGINNMGHVSKVKRIGKDKVNWLGQGSLAQNSGRNFDPAMPLPGR